MKTTSLLLILLLINGCVGARLSSGPNTSPLIKHEDLTSVGVAATVDDRESEKVGTIGAATITVRKSDLANVVGNYLIKYINEKVGLNVERVQMNETGSIKLAASKNKVNRIIILTIKTLNMFSLDALLQPVDVNLTLELRILGEGGDEIYRRTVTAHYAKRIKIPVIEKNTGELVESVAKEALRQYSKDQDLKKIIAKFKYGTFGGTLAKLF